MVPNCNNPIQQASASKAKNWVQIQGVVKGESLVGQITLNSAPTPVEFNAQREKPMEQQENQH